jgi:epsilon-lactone hydrolase
MKRNKLNKVSDELIDRSVRPKAKRKTAIILLSISGVAVLCLLAFRAEGRETKERDIYIPSTISPEAQRVLEDLKKKKIYAGTLPAPGDLEAWRKAHEEGETPDREIDKTIKRSGVIITETELGGVPILDIRPRDWEDNGKVLVYTHGGAYTMFSARSTLEVSAPMSRAAGLKVISVDYTTAPFADWKKIQEQVITVFKALLAEGYSMDDIAIYGDSAGGGLAVSTVLNLRDRGMGMPAAVLLLSPWVDLGDRGDTARTLKDADPTLTYTPALHNSALAYADGLDLSDPRVSPLYGDFEKGFPPSLITEGTKCIFLSTSVRLYQALQAAGQKTKLDIYEGMWHVFQLYPIPESEVAITRAADFINEHLK